MNRLAGKVAVVTGATSGIGAAIARRFVAEGAQVVLAGRRADNGRAIARQLGEAARFHRTDVSVDTDVEDLIHTTAERFGGLDVLVNNAGTPATISSVTDVEPAGFRRVFDVNVSASAGSRPGSSPRSPATATRKPRRPRCWPWWAKRSRRW
ncbi:SDR family NAD(P)-dependent oxidoreductase [Amycolatopsis rhabdoformis]|uniref:SDR family NAD(P)-dependent oxidoreductase n=1 Tax=Amycolatopsis rhabdoformis TaxID=1448059 RepID=A0ABZ1IG78_9PSEU|nr:SDR family NAD(P)-dependent oxidoreductase [Amycolatopsis rhabdoformis]WSE32942.1 SDR family NAD(P)-dependent oxidoreductase [Amycolatopsis rhabdoformis]